MFKTLYQYAFVTPTILQLKLGTVLIFAPLSTPAIAADIKPGLWQITQSMDSEQLPEQLKREKTLAQCVSAEDAADMTLAMRKRWQQLDCAEISIERDGDAIVTSAQCQ